MNEENPELTQIWRHLGRCNLGTKRLWRAVSKIWEVIDFVRRNRDSNHVISLPWETEVPLSNEKILPDRESNPGVPRDRRGYSPLYYRGLAVKDLHPRSTWLFETYHSWQTWFFGMSSWYSCTFVTWIIDVTIYVTIHHEQCERTSGVVQTWTRPHQLWVFFIHAQIFRLLLKISVEETN